MLVFLRRLPYCLTEHKIGQGSRGEDDSVGNGRAVYRARPNHRSQLKLETDGVWLRRSGVWIMVTLDVQETLNFLYACCAFKIEDGPT